MTDAGAPVEGEAVGDRRQGDERRSYLRFDGQMAPMKFKRFNNLPSGEPDTMHSGSLIDISEGGMCFMTDHPITGGERIEYEVDSPVGKVRGRGVGRILRIGQDPDRFLVAVEFVS